MGQAGRRKGRRRLVQKVAVDTAVHKWQRLGTKNPELGGGVDRKGGRDQDQFAFTTTGRPPEGADIPTMSASLGTFLLGGP